MATQNMTYRSGDYRQKAYPPCIDKYIADYDPVDYDDEHHLTRTTFRTTTTESYWVGSGYYDNGFKQMATDGRGENHVGLKIFRRNDLDKSYDL